MLYKKITIAFCCAIFYVFFSFVQAQSQLPLERRVNDADIWNTIEFTYSPAKRHSFILQLNGRSSLNPDTKVLIEGLPFYRVQYRIGYGYMLSKHWFAQMLFQTAKENRGNIVFYRPALSHLGNIGRFSFTKSFLLDALDFQDKKYQDFTRLRFLMSLGRTIRVMDSLHLTLNTSIEFFKNINHLPPPEKHRFFDESRFRIEAGMPIYRDFRLFFSIMWQSRYFVAEPIFECDDIGNCTQLQPERRLNLRTPVWGITIRKQFRKKIKTTSTD